MIEYNKIDTVFERDITGSKKLIEGQFRDETVKYLRNMPWRFTEKIDGTNIRVHWDGHKVEFGGRTDRAQIPAPLVNKLNEMFGGNEAEELFEQKFGQNDVILFGEGYGPKIQNGGLYRDDVSFIMFDVMINGNYQPRASVEDIAKCFGVDVVPVIFVGTITEAVDYVKVKRLSTIGRAPMEGLVGVPLVELHDRCGKRLIVKIKARDFILD